MSTNKPQNDPSMDDILASIRKIISDDEAKAASGPGVTSSAPPQRPTQPAPPRAAGQAANPGDARPTATNPGDAPGSDDVLLLTNLIEELPPSLARPSSTAATQTATRPADELPPSLARPAPPKPSTPPSSTPSPGITPIPSPSKAGVMDIYEPQPPIGSQPPRPMASPPNPPGATTPLPTMPGPTTPTVVSGKGVEDLVREMLRPLLLEWMDKNLPGMVEKLVEREVERLARR